jgi:O-antigen/teichoic acid export membrane protein
VSEATRQVGSAVFWSVFARSGRFVLSLVSSVIVVRGLGSYDYGVLSLVRTFLTFSALIAGAGLGQALLKFLPALRVARDVRGARRLVRNVLIAQVVVWILLLAGIYLARPVWETIFHFEQYDGIGNLIFAAVSLSVFELFFSMIAQILNAHYDTKRLSLAAIVNHLILIVLLIVLLRAGVGVLGVLVAGAAGNLAACLMLLGHAARHFSAQEEGADRGGITGGRIARFALPLGAIGVLNMIVWRQSEIFFLAHYRSAVETGYFDLAYRLPQIMLEFIPQTVWPIIMAGFSEVYEKNRDSLVTAIDRYYKVLFLLCAPVCVFGVTFAGKMIPVLYSEAMAPAAVPAQLFFVIFTLSVFSTPLSMSLYVMEKSHVNLIIVLLLAATNIGLDFILIPRYGVVGAIVPVALVIAVSPLLYKAALARFLTGARIPFRFIGKCFAASSPVLLLLPLVTRVQNIFQLSAVAAAGALLLVLSFKRFGVLGTDEMRLLEGIPGAVRILRFIAPREARAGGEEIRPDGEGK